MSIDPPGPAGAENKVFRRFVVLLLLVLAVLAFVIVRSLQNLNRSIASNDWVNHTHAEISEADAIEAGMEAAEAALRTYLLTGDPRDRVTCQEAFADLAGHVEVAKALAKSAPVESQQILQIETLLAQRASFARDLLKARDGASGATVPQLLSGDTGAVAIHEIIRRLGDFKETENSLLAARDTAEYLQAQTTRWTELSGVALDILLLAGAAWLVWDDLAARRRAVAALQEANTLLEVKVQERTAELTAANRRLTDQNLEGRWTNQALDHQLRYSQLIINSISDLVLVVTKALNISRINPAVTHLTGWNAADLVDRPLAHLVRFVREGEAKESLLFDPVAQALADGHDLRAQPALVTDSRGRQTPVHLHAYPVRDRDKVVGGVIVLQLVAPASTEAK